MGQKSTVKIFSLAQLHQEGASAAPRVDITTEGKAVTSLWGMLDRNVITGHHDGDINVWDLEVSSGVVKAKEGREIGGLNKRRKKEMMDD